MRCFNTLKYLFPKNILSVITETVSRLNQPPEEIRIHRGQPIILRRGGKEYPCGADCITEREIMHIVLSAANGSLHSVTEYLKNGFLPLKNGHRMGICAEGIYQNGALSGIQNVTSLCIRIAREHHGCADRVLETISFLDFRSTIIVAPPGGGKTTFLREVIRKLSQKGKYISVSDERGEISGFCNGETAFDIGPRTDVLYGIRKQEAAIMLLRTMAPDILAMDEITAYNDIHVIKEALGCGVELLATMHGKDRTVFEKPVFFEISQMKAFQYAVFIEVKDGNRFYHVEELYA